jgi:hypothetical protein
VFNHPVTYHDFNGQPHNEELFFNMMTPEMADLEFNPMFEGSLAEYIKTAMKSGEGQKIYTFFKMLVVNSYGRRSEDGARFLKKAEWTEEFLNSPAWEQFFLWLTDDPKNAEKFWNGIFPEAIKGRVGELESVQTGAKKLQDMSKEELLVLMQKRLDERKAVEA